MDSSQEGSHPKPQPFQMVLSGFEDLIVDAVDTQSVPKDEDSETDHPKTTPVPHPRNRILPGFEEFFQTDE